MKKVCYKDAIEWIALKDNIDDDDRFDLDVIKSQETSRIISDLFEVEVIRVGNDVITRRKLKERDDRKHIVGSKSKEIELY